MYEDILGRVDLFANLNKKELKELTAGARERKFSAGATLFSQGDTGTGLYVITHGKIRITQAQNPDRAEEDLGTLEGGEVLGEMALLDDLPRSATAIAVEDTTVILLPVWDFRMALHNQPDIALKLLAVLSRRLRKAEGRLADR